MPIPRKSEHRWDLTGSSRRSAKHRCVHCPKPGPGPQHQWRARIEGRFHVAVIQGYEADGPTNQVCPYCGTYLSNSDQSIVPESQHPTHDWRHHGHLAHGRNRLRVHVGRVHYGAAPPQTRRRATQVRACAVCWPPATRLSSTAIRFTPCTAATHGARRSMGTTSPRPMSMPNGEPRTRI